MAKENKPEDNEPEETYEDLLADDIARRQGLDPEYVKEVLRNLG